jgi:hypothetical protein
LIGYNRAIRLGRTSRFGRRSGHDAEDEPYLLTDLAPDEPDIPVDPTLRATVWIVYLVVLGWIIYAITL